MSHQRRLVQKWPSSVLTMREMDIKCVSIQSNNFRIDRLCINSLFHSMDTQQPPPPPPIPTSTSTAASAETGQQINGTTTNGNDHNMVIDTAHPLQQPPATATTTPRTPKPPVGRLTQYFD